MITKERAPESVDPRTVGYVAALVLGLVGGLLLGNLGDDSGADSSGAVESHPEADLSPFRTTAVDSTRPDHIELGPALELEFSSSAVAALEAARARALREGTIHQEPGDVVPVTVRVDGQVARGTARLKGDWLDHVDTDKWSLRLNLDDGHVFGMSELSIQHPKTRGYYMEWLILEAGRREGLLAPRCRFVDVSINGRPTGIYYLEEHFTKEMLESQGRRDGPIVRFLEDSLWSTWRQYEHTETSGPVPRLVAFAELSLATDAAGYGERRLAKVEKLNARLDRALGQMRDIKALTLAELPNEPATLIPIRIRALEALEQLQGRTIDEVFVAEKFGRMLAVYSLFRAAHGLSWHQLRFYHDPILDRLEPVLFDTGATSRGPFGDLMMTHIALEHFHRSAVCREESFRSLGRLVQPEALDQMLEDLGPDLRRYVAAMKAEEILPPEYSLETVLTELREYQAHLRTILEPEDSVNFSCRLLSRANSGPDGEVGTAWLEVEAWPTTSIPVRIDGFRFGNGRFLSAAESIDATSGYARRDDDTVVLSSPGRHLRFRFPADLRLMQLRNVQAIKRAIRDRAVGRDQNVEFELQAQFGWLHSDRQFTEPLRIRRAGAEAELDGRPASPSLADALRDQPCLVHDVEYDTLTVKPGEWDVRGDLIVPTGYRLQIHPGTRLRFEAGAIFASFDTAVRFNGLPGNEVVLEAQLPDRGWGGVVVAGTGLDKSIWKHVVVRSADQIARGSWQTTGGVTFYRAPIEMTASRIEQARGEDALNVFATSFELIDCVFDGAPSDLLDGDFVRGSVRGCVFSNSGEDGVDLSGSRVTIEASRFVSIGDKAISAGERTHADVRQCEVESASIGVAAKDQSTVSIEGLEWGTLDNYGIAAFVKKSEYGPSAVIATGLSAGGTFGRSRYIVQTGCDVRVDGTKIATRDLDVQALYEQKVLGK